MNRWQRAYRRLAYGRPIIIVSGLPRSGTSMMMRMLEAGGMPVWQDGIRAADDQNPYGYYELERVKDLDKHLDKAWVRIGRGRAIKVISSLLDHLPRTNNYRVVFMQRELHEVLASQASMLTKRGRTGELGDDNTLRKFYEAHLRKMKHLLSHDAAFSSLDVEYADVLSNPHKAAEEVNQFVGGHLDVARMIAAVDEGLYRHRARTTPAD
jgi:hypothetical protein